MNIFTKIGVLIVGGVLALGGIFGGHSTTPQTSTPSFGAYSPTGGGTYRTGQSIGTSDTTLKLSSFKEPVSNIPYTMAYLGSDIEYITISPQSSISEFASFSGITQNSDGSATLTGLVRGMSRTPGTGGCVASTTLAQSHAGQSIVILSNPPCQLAEYLPLRTVATSSAATVIGSTTPWHYDFNPNFAVVASTSLVSLGYVNNSLAAGGAPITTSVAGIGLLATAAQAALGTATGVFNAVTYNLLLPNSLATSTPGNSTITGDIPTATGRFLAQSWLDLTAAFSFAKLTTTATTTIPASGVNSNPLILNSIAYAFPSVQGASSTVLSTNGQGVLTWQPAGTGKQYSLVDGSSVSAGASSYATSSVLTVPAGVFTASSTIQINGEANCNSSGGTTCTFYLRNSAGKTFASCALTLTASVNYNGFIQMTVGNQSSLSAQNITGVCNVGSTVVANSTTLSTVVSQIATNSTIDTSQATTWELVVQSSSSMTTTLNGFSIVVTP